MATRLAQIACLLAAVEVTPGVDAAPTAANAMLISNIKFTYDVKTVDRKIMLPYFGNSGKVVTTKSAKIEFEMECSGSGTAGTPPPLGVLLKGCGMAETILTAPARVEYTPITTGQTTLTLYYGDSGIKHAIVGAQGTWTFLGKVGDVAKFKFEFVGADNGALAATVTGNYSAFQAPVPIVKASTIDATLGATYSAGALTGGTKYASTGPEIQFGNKLTFTANCSREGADIVDRSSTAKITYELSAADEVTFISKMTNMTMHSFGFGIGSVAGNKMLLFASNVQHSGHNKETIEEIRYVSFNLDLQPTASGSGNDEFRLVFL